MRSLNLKAALYILVNTYYYPFNTPHFLGFLELKNDFINFDFNNCTNYLKSIMNY